jgi:hypothetical protein
LDGHNIVKFVVVSSSPKKSVGMISFSSFTVLIVYKFARYVLHHSDACMLLWMPIYIPLCSQVVVSSSDIIYSKSYNVHFLGKGMHIW